MRIFFLITLFCSFWVAAQPEATIMTKDSIPLQADSFVGVDSFGSIYYIQDNVLFKKTEKKLLNYNNLQLGKLSSVDILNPLQITLFYQGFNTVVQLDNTLNELRRLDFNNISNFRNVQFARTGIDKQLWVFNLDNNQLELFNFQTEKIKSLNQPIRTPVIAMTSNYNFCWVLTKDKLYQFNFYGSLLAEIPNDGFVSISQENGNLLLQKEDSLWYLEKNSAQPKKIHVIEKPFLQLHLSGGFLYIYHPAFLEKLRIEIPKG